MPRKPSTFRFIHLLLGKHNTNRAYLIAWLLAATLSTTAAIGLITSMVGYAPDEPVDFQRLGLFLLVAVLVIFSQFHVLTTATDVVETAVEHHRKAFAKALRSADLSVMEAYGTARLYGILNRTTTVMAEAGPPVIYGLITAAVITVITLYVFYLSPLVFTVMLVVGVATIYLFRFYNTQAEPDVAAARGAERQYMSFFVQLLDGIKEVKLNRGVGKDLQQGYIAAAASRTHETKQQAATALGKAFISVYAGFYLLTAAVVFAVPQYLGDANTIIKLTYMTIFLLAMLNVMLRAWPMLVQANRALDEVDLVMAALSRNELTEPSLDTPSSFDEIILDSVEVRLSQYNGTAHLLGPMDLKLTPGTIMALTGRSGGGKTTLLRTLCGLLRPSAGRLIRDGRQVAGETHEAYRMLFAAVFEDSHLFDRFYGQPETLQQSIRDKAVELGLPADRLQNPHQVHWSRSQKQRLLLAIALCEQRPVLLLDDLEAGQDQDFIDHLKENVLPALIKQNTCVVLATAARSQLVAIADQVVDVDIPVRESRENA